MVVTVWKTLLTSGPAWWWETHTMPRAGTRPISQWLDMDARGIRPCGRAGQFSRAVSTGVAWPVAPTREWNKAWCARVENWAAWCISLMGWKAGDAAEGFSGGPKRDKPAQVSFLSFFFYVLFFSVFFYNCFESNLNFECEFHLWVHYTNSHSNAGIIYSYLFPSLF
jgi:hypothetical protein